MCFRKLFSLSLPEGNAIARTRDEREVDVVLRSFLSPLEPRVGQMMLNSFGLQKGGISLRLCSLSLRTSWKRPSPGGSLHTAEAALR